jgi:predicted RNA methylase
MTQLDLLSAEPRVGHDPALSQWFPPAPLAERIVRWALEGWPEPQTILEPSAGDGALIRPLPETWGRRVTACEIDPRWNVDLCMLPQIGVILAGDFLTFQPTGPYDLCLMNPPYEYGLDGDFVAAALRCSRRVVALLRLAALAGVQRRHQIWERACLRRLAILSGRPSFVGPSTGSPRHDFCVVEIVHEETDTAVEWWGWG